MNPITVTLATATPGGGFPAYGDAFAGAVMTADPSITVTCQNTKGSLENVNLLAEGSVDLGLVAGETAMAALNSGKGITILTAMYATPGMFALRGDAPERSIEELLGKTIVWGAKSSGFVVLARQVMAGLGLDIERDFNPILLDKAGDGPAMVLDGRAAALWGGGAGWPGFAGVAKGEHGIRFLPPRAAECVQILNADPTLQPMSLPAVSYVGQEAAIPSVGTWSLVLARPGLEEEAGYRLAAALHAAREDIAKRLPQASETTGENTLAAASSAAMIHLGVRRFLRA
ncbi:MAG: immunogenic protein precursor [Rubritepida sp.]|nr:immunogenic protein precursor [Rubritepida sp.]